MTTVYDTTWPSSFIDQKHQADILLARAKILYVRKTAVTVVRYARPTQGDWENAFVAKTGLPLPIPVGTRLFWKSLKSGRVTQFGTINDVSNGLSSSGTVYNFLNMNYTQPSMRFLGYFDNSKAEIVNRQFNAGAGEIFLPAMTWLPSGSFIYGLQMGQVYEWMSRGLESLMLVYRCRTADLIAAPSPKLDLFFNRGSSNIFLFGATGGTDAQEGMELGMPGSATTAALLGTPTANVAGYRIPILSKQTASDSAANAFSYGQLWIHNMSQQLETVSPLNSPRENYHNPAIWGIGSYFGATITEANTNINIGMVVKEDNGYSFIDNYSLGIAQPISGVGIQSAKVWVYGLFKNPTGDISE